MGFNLTLNLYLLTKYHGTVVSGTCTKVISWYSLKQRHFTIIYTIIVFIQILNWLLFLCFQFLFSFVMCFCNLYTFFILLFKLNLFLVFIYFISSFGSLILFPVLGLSFILNENKKCCRVDFTGMIVECLKQQWT